LEDIDPAEEFHQDLIQILDNLTREDNQCVQRVTHENLREIADSLPAESNLWKAEGDPASVSRRQKLDSFFGPGSFARAPHAPRSTSRAATRPPASETRSRPTSASFDVRNILGFWKILSNFDVNPSSGPGQIIIPVQFVRLFPPLGEEAVTSAGARQADALVRVRFVGASITHLLRDARFIRYAPAPHQPRPNVEYRFTFRDQSINPGILNPNDILVFERLTDDTDGFWFQIFHLALNDDRYATIRALSSRRFGPLYPAR
jgi:hypothetical protein